MSKKKRVTIIVCVILIISIIAIIIYRNSSPIKKTDYKGTKTYNYNADLDGDGINEAIEIVDTYQEYINKDMIGVADASPSFCNHKYTIKVNEKKIDIIEKTDKEIHVGNISCKYPGDEIYFTELDGPPFADPYCVYEVYTLKDGKFTEVDKFSISSVSNFDFPSGRINGNSLKMFLSRISLKTTISGTIDGQTYKDLPELISLIKDEKEYTFSVENKNGYLVDCINVKTIK